MQISRAMTINRSKISQRIRFARQWVGQTQEQLGEATNRSQATIARIEAAKQSIDAEDVAIFSQALGVKTDFFISEEVDINAIFRVD